MGRRERNDGIVRCLTFVIYHRPMLANIKDNSRFAGVTIATEFFFYLPPVEEEGFCLLSSIAADLTGRKGDHLFSALVNSRDSVLHSGTRESQPTRSATLNLTHVLHSFIIRHVPPTPRLSSPVLLPARGNQIRREERTRWILNVRTERLQPSSTFAR